MNELRGIGRNYNIVHGHGVWRSANLFPLILPRNYKARIVWSPHGMFTDWSWNHHRLVKKPFWKLLQKHALGKVDCFHATAVSEYEEIRRRGFAQPVAIIPIGITTPKIECQREKKKYIVFLSRLHKKKGLEMLFAAWNQLAQKFDGWELKIAGPLDSPYARGIVNKVFDDKLPRVEFLGEVLGKEKELLLSNAAVFILPSYSENFGIAVAEALAHGVPVITTRETPWEGVEENKCGWWVDATTKSIADAMRIAMTMPMEQLNAMGIRGSKWMKSEYSWVSVAQKMMEVYRWLGDSAPRPEYVKLD